MHDFKAVHGKFSQSVRQLVNEYDLPVQPKARPAQVALERIEEEDEEDAESQPPTPTPAQPPVKKDLLWA